MTNSPSNTSSNSPNELVDESLLTINTIVDRNGISVINKTTYERAIKVAGINAEPNSAVDVMDGLEKLGEAPSDANGDFVSALLDVKNFDCCNVRVVGRSIPYPSSLPKKFTAATATPITNKVLVGGEPIADGDTINATEVTFLVNSIPNQNARAFNGETLLKTEPANNCGICTIVLSELEQGSYIITIKAPNDNESAPFRFSVKEDVQPVTLEKLVDDNDNVIPPDTDTPETSLFAIGKGESGEEVELFDDSNSLGTVITHETTGEYRIPTGTLTEGPHPFTIVGKYPGGGKAGPYTITVEAATDAPTETRIHDAAGNVIPDGGDLAKTWLIARGNYLPNNTVLIKVNGVIQANAESTNAAGKWVFFLSSLTVGTVYKISALTPDGKAESNEWSVKAITPV